MICLVLRKLFECDSSSMSKAMIANFAEKLHFRDSGIDEISGPGSGLESRRDPGIPIPGLQSLALIVRPISNDGCKHQISMPTTKGNEK